jgi:hypothetical protein
MASRNLPDRVRETSPARRRTKLGQDKRTREVKTAQEEVKKSQEEDKKEKSLGNRESEKEGRKITK